MHTIEIADDVYEYLVRNTSRIGEDASSILRRLLKLPLPDGGIKIQLDPAAGDVAAADGALNDFVKSKHLAACRTATEKFLQILGFVHNVKRDEFGRVLKISGRNRVYFARSREVIAESGKDTNPRLIPGSDYWVMTKTDTGLKREILVQALILLRYSSEVAEQAARALG